MNDFLKFLDKKLKYFPMHVEISYNKTCDWSIYIYKKGCASDYPNSEKDRNDVVIVYVQDGDMELCFAKAHVALKEWLLEYEGCY